MVRGKMKVVEEVKFCFLFLYLLHFSTWGRIVQAGGDQCSEPWHSALKLPSQDKLCSGGSVWPLLVFLVPLLSPKPVRRPRVYSSLCHFMIWLAKMVALDSRISTF